MELFDLVGFSDVYVEIMDHGLNATLAIYYIDPKDVGRDTYSSYLETVEKVRSCGKTSSPIVVVKAIV